MRSLLYKKTAQKRQIMRHTAFFMMTSSNGNIFRVTGHLCREVPGEFPTQRPVTRSFDVYFDLRLNKRLSKQSWGWWFETPSLPLCRHSNVHLVVGSHHALSMYSGHHTTSTSSREKTFYCKDDDITEYEMTDTKISSIACIDYTVNFGLEYEGWDCSYSLGTGTSYPSY